MEKRGELNETVIFVGGIILIALFFTLLIFSIFFITISNSKESIRTAETTNLKSLTNNSFTIIIISIFLFLIILLVNQLLKSRKLTSLKKPLLKKTPPKTK